MARFIFTRFIKTLMMTTPFITMIVMVLALWGVGGKTTYISFDSHQKKQDGALIAENYLVSGTKADSKELCSTELKPKDEVIETEKPDTVNKEMSPVKIDWEHVV